MSSAPNPRQNGGPNVGKILLFGALLAAIAAVLYAVFKRRNQGSG